MSAPSPSPSMPPPNLKRPRASNAPLSTVPSSSAAAAGSTSTSTGRSHKRRKPEGSVGPEGDKRSTVGSTAGNAGGPAAATVAGKAGEEWAEGEVRTKVDFNELPVETLYKYLEHHDLLPRWDVSPWSEDPCTPPNQLYTLPPAAPIVPAPTHSSHPQEPLLASPSAPSTATAPTESASAAQGDITMSETPAVNGAIVAGQTGFQPNTEDSSDPLLPQLQPSALVPGESSHGPITALDDKPRLDPTVAGEDVASERLEKAGMRDDHDAESARLEGLRNGATVNSPSAGDSGNAAAAEEAGGAGEGKEEAAERETAQGGGEDGEEEEGENGVVEPPTTRSKTAPSRLPPPSPTPAPESAVQIKRGVITLSDVYAAREVLAEKANAHWMKGLGGGQNKEGETIVNFLYKMKVGPGRLLRVYNPTPSTFPW